MEKEKLLLEDLTNPLLLSRIISAQKDKENKL